MVVQDVGFSIRLNSAFKFTVVEGRTLMEKDVRSGSKISGLQPEFMVWHVIRIGISACILLGLANKSLLYLFYCCGFILL